MKYYIEIRQRIKGAPHYMEWVRVPGNFTGRAAIDSHAAYMMQQSHSLDIRGIRKEKNLTHTINYRVGNN